MRVLMSLVGALALAACATGSSIVTGTPRAPIAPEEVRLYSEPPQNFEVIGILSSSSETGWTSQHDMDLAVADMRRRAAAMGANGVLIEQTSERRSLSATGGYGTPLTVFETSGQQVSGRAIYVLPAADAPTSAPK